MMHWGLVPSWAKDASIGNRMINARAETLTEKRTFKALLGRKRCLVLADGFYEWQRDGSVKTPWYISQKSGEPMAIGALWVLLEDRAAQLAPLLVTGLLGGFTTFSAFSLDALRLVEAGRAGTAMAYVLGSVILSIAACALGLWIARSLS